MLDKLINLSWKIFPRLMQLIALFMWLDFAAYYSTFHPLGIAIAVIAFIPVAVALVFFEELNKWVNTNG